LRRLITNADDFGFTRDINEGIVEAHRNGILTATTLMANGAEFDHAVSLAQANDTLDIGCHLVLTGGTALSTGDLLPTSVPNMMAAVTARRIDPYAEFRLQIERILAAGLEPTHLDTHKHTHLFPPVLDAVARLSLEFEIPWVRRPFDLPISGGNGGAKTPWLLRTTSTGLQFLRSRFHRVLTAHGCLSTDHFAGFQMTGLFGETELIRLIETLPNGTTEFMCHPGKFGEQLAAAPTRLKESRQWELDALLSPRVREALATHGVRLVNYRDLTATAA
jgi:predicted glycoside hydrolase/deacetylase ChbG (UPF0249 family)